MHNPALNTAYDMGYRDALKEIDDILHTDEAAVFDDVLMDIARKKSERRPHSGIVTYREEAMARTIERIWDITHPVFCPACRERKSV